MRILSIIGSAILYCFLTTTGIYADDKTSSITLKTHPLEAVVKDVISRLEKTAKEQQEKDVLPLPYISDVTITSLNENEVKVTGTAHVKDKGIGKAELTIKKSGQFLIIDGAFPNIIEKVSEDDEKLKSCKFNLDKNIFSAKYDMSLKAFTSSELAIKNLDVECASIKASFDSMAVKARLKPAKEEGQYLSVITYSGSNLAIEEAITKPGSTNRYGQDDFEFSIVTGPINPKERETILNTTYEKFWPAKFPALSLLSDLYFVQKDLEKYLKTFEKVKTARIDITAQNYKMENDNFKLDTKHASETIDLLKLHTFGKIIDSSEIHLPKAKLTIKYPTNSAFDVKLQGELDPKTIANTIRKTKNRQDNPLTWMSLFANVFGAKYKLNISNDQGAVDINGHYAGIPPVINIDLTVKVSNMLDFAKSVFNLKPDAPTELKTCMAAFEGLLASLKPLAVKHKKTTDKDWYFRIQGLLANQTFLVNQEDIKTIQLPQVKALETECKEIHKHLL